MGSSQLSLRHDIWICMYDSACYITSSTLFILSISTATRHKPDYQVIHSSETVLLEAVHSCAARDVLLNAVSPFCVALCRTFICDI